MHQLDSLVLRKRRHILANIGGKGFVERLDFKGKTKQKNHERDKIKDNSGPLGSRK